VDAKGGGVPEEDRLIQGIWETWDNIVEKMARGQGCWKEKSKNIPI
jgi:hypothetical protein